MRECLIILCALVTQACTFNEGRSKDEKMKALEQQVTALKRQSDIRDSILKEEKLANEVRAFNESINQLNKRFIFVILEFKEGTKNTRISSSPYPGLPPEKSEWVVWKDYKTISDVIEVQNWTEDEKYKQMDLVENGLRQGKRFDGTIIKIAKRTCREYNTYSEASSAREEFVSY
jgi:hypothetical protein